MTGVSDPRSSATHQPVQNDFGRAVETHIDDAGARSRARVTLQAVVFPAAVTVTAAAIGIEDERPDYSGVGGIASIDSGIWVIIAFHAYVSETRDMKSNDDPDTAVN